MSTPRPTRTVAAHRVAAAAVTAVAAVVVLPDLLGLDVRSPFAQLVAFRPWLLVGLVAVLVPVVLVAARRPAVRPAAAGLLAVALAGTALVLPRVVPDPAPSGGAALTVLALNAHDGAADVEEVAALLRAERPDLVALPEAGERFARRLAPLVEPLGYRIRTATGASAADVDGVTALVAPGLGDVRVEVGRATSLFPTVEVTGGGLGALRFVAYHAAAPVPDLLPGWNADLALLSTWCAGGGPVVVAGDLNATLDHSPLRAGAEGCADAAEQRGAGLVPTWGPGGRWRAVGPQIDHVLVGGGIAAEAFAAHDVTGSDHRAVVTRLRVP